jgi:hypothetical protein
MSTDTDIPAESDNEHILHVELIHTGELSFLGTEPCEEKIECIIYQELVDGVGLSEQ